MRNNQKPWSSGWKKKRENIDTKNATSPTVSTEAVMITATIDTLEGRDMVIVDIPGEYISSVMDDDVNIVLRGTLSELMVTADPELYRKFVSHTI